jgi:DNA-binding transcriptional LysR family regulator
VADELSFTRAARRLHLAQPPLSRHIRTLEEKIGARLFDRQTRAVALTPAGRVFHEESRGLLAQLVRAGETARRAALGEETRLRLGFVSAVLGGEIVRVLRGFREAHPSVQLVMHDLPPADQMRLIAEGRLDAGFIGLLPTERTPGLRFVPWHRERLFLFVPAGHPLAHRSRVDLAALRGERFVAVSGEAAPAFSVLVHDLCRQAGFRPRIVLESTRAQAVAVMVAAGSGVAILPESLRAFVGSTAPAVALKGSPEITHVFARPATPPAPALKNLLEALAAAKPKQTR